MRLGACSLYTRAFESRYRNSRGVFFLPGGPTHPPPALRGGSEAGEGQELAVVNLSYTENHIRRLPRPTDKNTSQTHKTKAPSAPDAERLTSPSGPVPSGPVRARAAGGCKNPLASRGPELASARAGSNTGTRVSGSFPTIGKNHRCFPDLRSSLHIRYFP